MQKQMFPKINSARVGLITAKISSVLRPTHLSINGRDAELHVPMGYIRLGVIQTGTAHHLLPDRGERAITGDDEIIALLEGLRGTNSAKKTLVHENGNAKKSSYILTKFCSLAVSKVVILTEIQLQVTKGRQLRSGVRYESDMRVKTATETTLERYGATNNWTSSVCSPACSTNNTKINASHG